MLETFGLVVAGIVIFLNIVGVSIPQWVNRKYDATDFGGRRQVGLLEYPSEVNIYICNQLITKHTIWDNTFYSIK